MKKLLSILLVATLFSCGTTELNVEKSNSDLIFPELATVWDEGMPLGNGHIGSLVWQKGDNLRMSLDRMDIWDLRPVPYYQGDKFKFEWLKDKLVNDKYHESQKEFDHKYAKIPGPTKIPGAGLEFPIESLGIVSSVDLHIKNALCEVKWENGSRMQTYVHASDNVGWFVFENVPEDFEPILIPPVYDKIDRSGGADESCSQGDLRRLGYTQGEVVKDGNSYLYHQKGWEDFTYDVSIRWKRDGNNLVGVWSLSSSLSEDKAAENTLKALKRGFKGDYVDHMKYWKKLYSKSSVTLPDTVLQKQYDNEIYKFASAAREDSYPISLQSVWTADNGQLPPWRGDFHHNLNTQYSYYQAYTGNYLEEGTSYWKTLWDQAETSRKYTKQYYQVDGLNVSGMADLLSKPMGGWQQYSRSLTVSAWLSQFFYLHWQYSMDEKFLKEIGYPYIKESAIFLENMSIINEDGKRTIPLSSTPEVYDNSSKAWFRTITNFDLSLIDFLFIAAEDMARSLDLDSEAAHWKQLRSELPDYNLDQTKSLTFAKGVPYNESHRHFSHAMAIHPLGTIDMSQGEQAQEIIEATIKKMDEVGPDYWCGYSYSWFGCMKARAFDGEGAAEALRIFAECFCLKNTFHANGDQTKSGKSKFTYRPFTLEGNFAFAAAIQEMLIQSHTGVVRVFPAIPKDWKDVSFETLRTVGAFIVSADKKEGKIEKVEVYSEKGGMLKIANPYDDKEILEISTTPGQTILLKEDTVGNYKF